MAASRSWNLPSTCGRMASRSYVGDQVAVGALIEIDVEVVVPEIGQDFFELPVAVDRAQQSCLRRDRARPSAAARRPFRCGGAVPAARHGEQLLAHARPGRAAITSSCFSLGQRLEALRAAAAACPGGRTESAAGSSISASVRARAQIGFGCASASPPAGLALLIFLHQSW